jgi:hypothetical protein
VRRDPPPPQPCFARPPTHAHPPTPTHLRPPTYAHPRPTTAVYAPVFFGRSYSALLRQRLGAMGAGKAHGTPTCMSQSVSTPDGVLPGRLADFKLSSTTTPDAGVDQSMVTPELAANLLAS